MSGFGLRLRRLREAAGISQLELSVRSGVETANISRIEAGIVSPREDTQARLLTAIPTVEVEERLSRFDAVLRRERVLREEG
jgi:transcriptional regulator with XRE-family HTH domain